MSRSVEKIQRCCPRTHSFPDHLGSRSRDILFGNGPSHGSHGLVRHSQAQRKCGHTALGPGSLRSTPTSISLPTALRRKKLAAKVEAYDEKFGIELVDIGSRKFWIRRGGTSWDGRHLLAYHVAEHEWVSSRNPEQMVGKGDIVIDCGAHVGAYSAQALAFGAEKVIAIDPDPTQVECLRRNFSAEIAEGRLIVVPKAIWSSEGSMTLNLGVAHSAMSSLIFENGGDEVEVPVTTIDSLVEELGLSRVDYIKIDIEGAEREALKGAMKTIRKHHPRMMLDAYHRPDDMEVLPTVISHALTDYRMTCGACTPRESGLIVPHYIFYE